MSAPVQVGPSPQGGGPVPSPDWDDVLADIGDRIRAERKARRLTEVELAQRASLDRTTIRRIQDGIGSLRVFAQACHGLGVRMDYLLSPEWRMPAPKPSLTPRQLEVLRETAGGDPLAVAAQRMGVGREAAASHLSQAYQRLGVAGLPREERRAAAARVAMQHGLFNSQ